MHHSVRARLLSTLVCGICLLILPATASATKGSPLHVDPNSPVAKEYALPLENARGAIPGSDHNGSLFGSGIKHRGSGSTAAGTAVSATAVPAADSVLRPKSGPGLLWMALAAAVVVVLGGAGGVALRRRR